MKRYFYIFLMMAFFMLLTFSIYYSSVFIAVFYRIVALDNIILFTDIMLSPVAYAIVILIGGIVGYRFGKKWWKIIYIDKVYRFKK